MRQDIIVKRRISNWYKPRPHRCCVWIAKHYETRKESRYMECWDLKDFHESCESYKKFIKLDRVLRAIKKTYEIGPEMFEATIKKQPLEKDQKYFKDDISEDISIDLYQFTFIY